MCKQGCLLVLLGFVANLAAGLQPGTSAMRGLRFQTILGSGSLRAHTTFHDSAAERSSPEVAPEKSSACGACTFCTCGKAKASRAGGAPSMLADPSEEDDGWEYQRIIESATYLETIRAADQEAIRMLKSFFDENPPSARPEDLADDVDIFG